MKKILSTLLLLFVFLFTYAQSRETRSVPVFNQIDFKIPGELYVTQGSPQRIEIETDEESLELIETRVSNRRLIIEKEDSRSRWPRESQVVVRVTLPDVEALHVSGSGDLIAEGVFDTDNLNLAVSGSGSIKINVNARGNIEANIAGSGDIDLSGECEDFESRISGSGDLVVDSNIFGTARFSIAGSGMVDALGKATDVEVNISGSGDLRATRLQAESANVRVSGSGNVQVFTSNSLDVSVSGSGSVMYAGSPSQVNTHTSGNGKVRKM